MQTSTMTIAVFTLTLAACDGVDSALTSPPPGVPTLAVVSGPTSAAPKRALSGACRAESAGPPVFTPPILNQLSLGTCQISHLGRTSIRTMQHVNVATGAQTAEITYTAANGDLLYATNVGTSTPTGPTTRSFVGINTVTGGTGRFTNATGQFGAEGTVDLATGNASFAYNGWISYDASSRVSP